ncbi:hypothetical protein J5N97_027869 [Dioscorea zingiberensis]|uniref:RING-type E3 ubiquitin transferase n=1 Tax=Dioscorea zingiberensis TaxID=325984 RepID=A0A9D5H494_9LILI|nr:hypothetical protein J5N97_027869 [Dioscorea zingiberensis]
MAVDDAGSTWKKRKKRSGAESTSKTRDVESARSAAAEVKNEVEEENSEEEGDFGTVVRINTDVLDCSICHEPFRPPIYECQNGHAVCSPCRLSHSGKCLVCSPPIDLIRCLALERVVKSVQISCINARYGCDTNLSYSDRETHHKICNYTPCTCPVSACAFKGSSISLSDHFQSHHENSAVKFMYGYCCRVAWSQIESPFLVLLGPDRRLFLLLNNNDTTRGSFLSMICISPRNEESNFEYELSVGAKTTLKLKASVESTTEWKGVYPTNTILFVPNGFCSSNRVSVKVSTKKCKPH